MEDLGLQTAVLDSVPAPALPAGKGALKRWLDSRISRLVLRDPQSPIWIHPSDSLWADRPELVTLAEELGIRVVAPPLKTLSLLGDRLTWLNHAAEALEIPTLVLPGEPSSSVAEFQRRIEERSLKFPFVLRSVRASGRLGCRVIRHADELGQNVPLWIEQHRLNIGEVLLFTEKWLEGTRRVSIPFCRFTGGHMTIFTESDISLQCSFERSITFCPAESLDAGALATMREWTRKLAEASAFVGVGAFEFVVDGARAYLVDRVPGLTSDIGAWETVDHVRAADWQLAALETSWAPSPMEAKTGTPQVAISMNIVAEHPIIHLPQPGLVLETSDRWIWRGGGTSAEFTLAAEQGQPASGLIGTLVASAPETRRAATLLRGILEETWIAGQVQTNERFLHEIMNHPWVREGIFHCDFVDEEFLPAIRPPAPLARVFAAIAETLDQPEPELRGSGTGWVVGDQKCPSAGLEPIAWVTPPSIKEAHGLKSLSGMLTLPDGRRVRVLAYPMARGRWIIRVGLWSLQVRRLRPGASRMRSLVPGTIHSILYREGVAIPAHSHALIVESGGTLVAHAFPREAKVDRWRVRAGDAVQAGDELAEVAPIG